jgi:hypothetical protein
LLTRVILLDSVAIADNYPVLRMDVDEMRSGWRCVGK